MKVLKTIFGIIFDPFRKATSYINMDKVSKFFRKKSYLVYIFSAIGTILLFLTFYVWNK